MPEINEKNGHVAIDANGIPILPGYRPPFAKGNDPRRFKGPYQSHKRLSMADASRVIAKLESLVDALSRKKRPNSTKNHSLQKLSPIAPLSGNQGVSPTKTQPATGQESQAKSIPEKSVDSACSPKSVAQAIDDDCPF